MLLRQPGVAPLAIAPAVTVGIALTARLGLQYRQGGTEDISSVWMSGLVRANSSAVKTNNKPGASTVDKSRIAPTVPLYRTLNAFCAQDRVSSPGPDFVRPWSPSELALLVAER